MSFPVIANAVHHNLQETETSVTHWIKQTSGLPLSPEPENLSLNFIVGSTTKTNQLYYTITHNS